MGLNRKNCVSLNTLIEAIAKQMCEGKTEQEIEEMYMEIEEALKDNKEHQLEDSNDT